MSVWRPRQGIQVKALGLVRRGGALLCTEVPADDGTVKGVRPPGGSIEHGETREAALRREFGEELSTDIRIAGPWIAIENIYDHEGHRGHEYIFAAPVELLDAALYRTDHMTIVDEIEVRAGWYTRTQLAGRGWPLYPTGLDAALDATW